MIAYLSGKVIRQGPTSVVLDAHGVGYEVKISLYTASAIEEMNPVALYIYHHFSQDHQALYGFSTDAERQLFILLISVSGVGPNTAQLILSYMNPQETERAILSDDVLAFRKVKGVGDKTARRILVDLRDKVARGTGDMDSAHLAGIGAVKEESLSALLALGFQRSQAVKALDKATLEEGASATVESLLRCALRHLS
jgi:Holliday junction DNA helicase RuvA